MRIRASRSRGVHLGNTKTGRERTAAISRRLRSALLAFQLLIGSGCVSTVRTAVTLPFVVAGHTLDLAGKSLDVAAKGVKLRHSA